MYQSFRPDKISEKKLEQILKKIYELEQTKIIDTKCMSINNQHILLKFEKGEPVGIMCTYYNRETGNCNYSDDKICNYRQGWSDLKK